MLNEEVHDLWLKSAAKGLPPTVRQVAEHQYELATNWHHEEVFYDLPARIDPNSPLKTKAYRELTRGGSKSTSLFVIRLYIAEYLAPFWHRTGLPIRPENRNLCLFGRDQTHIREEILGPLKHLIVNYAPWLRTPDWKGVVLDTDEPDEDGIRRLADMKSKGAQKWESYRIDLANGITIKSRTIRQSARGLHIFYADFDDILTEENVAQSSEILAMIDGALMPAIEPGGLVLWDGTPQGPGDCGDQILQRPDWDRAQYPAMDADGSRGYAEKNRAWLGPSAALLGDAHLACLWPARITPASLEEARGHTRETDAKFRREYMLERVTNDSALVHPEDMVAAKDDTLSYHHRAMEGHHYGGGLDPSGRRRDEAAFCLGSVLANGTRIPLHFKTLGVNPHLPAGEGELSVVEELNDLSQRFGCFHWLVEANGFQSIIIGLQRRKDPSVVCTPFDLGANKHTERGWKKVRTVFQSRLVRLPYRTAEDKRITDAFLHQLRGLQVVNGDVVEDKSRPNDLVSAFFLFLLATDTPATGTTATVVALPRFGSPSMSDSPAAMMARGDIAPAPAGQGRAEFAGLDSQRPGRRQPGLKGIEDRLARAHNLRRK